MQYTFLSSNHCEGSQKVSLNFSFPIFFHSCCTSFLPIFPFVLICLAFCPSFLSSFAPYLFYISCFKLLNMEYKWRHCLNKSALHNKLNLAFNNTFTIFPLFLRLETLLLDSNFFSQVTLSLLLFRYQRDISYHYWSNHFYHIKVHGMWNRIKVVHIGSILPCPCKIPEGGDFSVRRAVQDLYFDGSYSFARDF